MVDSGKKALYGVLRFAGRRQRLVCISWPLAAWQAIGEAPYAQLEVDQDEDLLFIRPVESPGLTVYAKQSWERDRRVGVKFWRQPGLEDPFRGYTMSVSVLRILPAERALVMTLKRKRRVRHASKRTRSKR